VNFKRFGKLVNLKTRDVENLFFNYSNALYIFLAIQMAIP
jgi:hypothetical protein